MNNKELVQIRKALTHTYGNDYGMLLFAKIKVTVREKKNGKEIYRYREIQ